MINNESELRVVSTNLRGFLDNACVTAVVVGVFSAEGANILDTLSPDTTDLVLTMVKQRVSFLLSGQVVSYRIGGIDLVPPPKKMENIKKRTSSQPVFFVNKSRRVAGRRKGTLFSFPPPPPRSPRHDQESRKPGGSCGPAQPFLVGGFPWGRFSIFPAGLFLAPKQFFFAKCYLSSMALSLGAPPPTPQASQKDLRQT